MPTVKESNAAPFTTNPDLINLEETLNGYSTEAVDIADAIRGIAEAMFMAHATDGDHNLLMGQLSAALTIIGNKAGSLAERQCAYSSLIGQAPKAVES